MDATLRVRNRGTLTLPADLRRKYGIEEGDVFRLLDVDGTFALTPMTPYGAETRARDRAIGQEASLSIEELLASLRQERERIYQEKHGLAA
jgi:bifunctional DNA-binding transcriptional regulator/antitoxin component of YhaV-PrlF toxin-antitoxin module